MQTVAIVTPIYATPQNKRLGLLSATLKSVDRQVRSHKTSLVHIIVDDGSSANVEGYLNYYRREYGGLERRYARRERRENDLHTSSNAINVGLDACIERSGEVFTNYEASNLRAVTYLHSDDLLTTDSIEKRLSALKDGFVHTDYLKFRNNKSLCDEVRWKYGSGYEALQSGENIFSFANHTIMWDFDFLRKLREYTYGQEGIFDTKMTQFEDADVSMSSAEVASMHDSEVYHVQFFSYLYRLHNASITGLGSEKEKELHKSSFRRKHHMYRSSPHKISCLQLMHDMAWSLLSRLPRSLEYSIKETIIGGKFPEFQKELEECLSSPS